ncbi:diaminopimelate epimerase [Roseospira goensis]|uniref:Diaminopimelate epimerase n=1 Tax=Roseospira goensis TaxID=391922 RepID=A0A7W6WLL7_9PROT|nr:diaminopimelate epimerase [Roseospira goensis]MBB4286979.1 diaminopimelate epimerase [Roseospira goensis]
MTGRGIPFRKMHGLGNDFVVVDTRTRPFALTTARAVRIADRRTGVGCDQLVTIEPPRPEHPGSAAFMGIRNADGGVVEACGNATRCVAHLLMEEAGTDTVILGTLAGPVVARRAGRDSVRVDMGRATVTDAILSAERDPRHLDLGQPPFTDAVAVSVGNPHVVAIVDDAEAVDLRGVGPIVEHHDLFPDRVNAEVVSRRDAGLLRMRVWERGAGITRACGTGACAAVVAAVSRGVIARAPTTVALDGGRLLIDWRDADDHVLMTGPVATAFTGVLDESLLP